MAEDSQASMSDDMNIKIKTMQPATYDVKIPMQVIIRPLLLLLLAYAGFLKETNRCVVGKRGRTQKTLGSRCKCTARSSACNLQGPSTGE